MGRKSRSKGVRGEIQARDLLRSWGYEAHRGRQYAGSPESPDVCHTIPGVHVEVAWRERHQPWEKMAQAAEDAGDGLPVLLLKRNGKEWLFVCRATDVPAVVRAMGGEDDA